MTKKDYIAIAKVFHDCFPSSEYKHLRGIWVELKNGIGNVFRDDNDLFDRNRFDKACYPENHTEI